MLFNFFYCIYIIMSLGDKLQPNRSLRNAFGIKGNRQKIVLTNNSSTIGQNEL